ncbi:MAG TPA: ribosome-associated translation inhibitor RaiA [Candidatus Eisenbacteria bacterium]|nr:ribosome-associated translation inhibitor RaiA [Candidatus Eisenbacteria bacterium]
MQITTTARHCDLDLNLKRHARTRLERLERYARDIQEAHLIVTLEKYRHLAEVTVRVNHHELASRQESSDARTAVDLALDGIEAQLRKLKERRQDWTHGGADGAQRADGAARAAGGEAAGEDTGGDEEE